MILLKRLFTAFFHLQEPSMLRQLAGKVARQCHSDVWVEVTRKPVDMGLPMLQGYIRSYAVGIVAAETETAAAECGWDSDLQRRVAASATEQVVQMVLRDFMAAGSTRTVRAAA